MQKEVRSISHDLVPRDLEHYGLLYELDKLQYQAETLHHITYVLKVEALQYRLPLSFELNIYRIIQELFQNTLKHSGASEVLLTINHTPQGLDIL